MRAFVLSGGASLGATQVGMLRALYEHGIAPDLITGASAGALNGSYIASRPPTPQTAADLAGIWRSLSTLEVFPPNPVTAVLGLVGQRDHLVPNTGVKRAIVTHAQFERIEDAPTPLHLIATDVLSGAERRLSRGPALDTVLASAAIPGVFPAIDFEGEKLVDGGVANNTPISDAVELGATTVYVLPTGSACRLQRPPQGALQMIVHALTLLINQRLARDIERYAGQAELIVLPPPCPQEVLPSDFSHAEQLIEHGYQLASGVLDHPDPAGYGRERSLERLRPHGH
jgi:NTE family protein